MSDIRIEFSFLTHRKRKRLLSLLGPQGVLSLIDLWINTAQNRPKGILTGMDEIDIANDAQWPGDPKALVSALVDSGFLVQNGNNCYEIHDWDKHQRWAYFSEERSAKARESVSKRWEKIRSKKGTYTKRIRNVQEPNTEGNTPSPNPFPIPSPIPNPYPNPKEKLRYGPYVLLTPDEHSKLADKYGSVSNLDPILEYMNLKIQSKGESSWRKEHKSDYATILLWDRNGWIKIDQGAQGGKLKL